MAVKTKTTRKDAPAQNGAAAETEAQAEEKQQRIGDNLIAVSPLPDWPGEIRFPRPTGGVYLAFNAAAKRQPDEDADDFAAYRPHWRGVCAIAEIRLEGLDTLDFADMPMDVIRWTVYCMDEYIRRFFRNAL